MAWSVNGHEDGGAQPAVLVTVVVFDVAILNKSASSDKDGECPCHDQRETDVRQTLKTLNPTTFKP